MTREELKKAADASWGQDRPVTAPGLTPARLEWLLRCEAAIKSIAAQFIHPKTTPEEMVDQILKGDDRGTR